MYDLCHNWLKMVLLEMWINTYNSRTLCIITNIDDKDFLGLGNKVEGL